MHRPLLLAIQLESDNECYVNFAMSEGQRIRLSLTAGICERPRKRRARPNHLESRAPSPDGSFLLGLAELAKDCFERADDVFARGPALSKREFQIECLVRRSIREDKRFRAARLRPRRGLTDLLPRRAALAGDFLDQGGHFLG